MLAGYIATRRLAVFPGVQLLAFVLPAFSASYGLMAAVLLFARVDYSRYELIVSYVLAVSYFYYMLMIERRLNRPRLVGVPQGKVAELSGADWVQWSVWSSSERLPDHVDGVVADLRAEMGANWEAFLARCALKGIPVYHVKQVQESVTGRVDIEHLSENNLGSLNPSSLYIRAKRGLDLLGAAVGLLIVLPLLGLAALAIKYDSPGPVFFTQPRMGYRGKVFRIWKLRTMRTQVEGAQYTEGDDARVTRVGRRLRKYRIDELPQMINILRGEMSWIGPRPESLPLSEWYEREIGFYSYRHIVRPGITGWAQVQQGYAARPENVKYKLHYDFYYIKHFSPWLDLVIAAQTVRTVLTGFGAR